MLRVCCHRIVWLFTVRVCSLFYGIGWLQTFGQLWACIPTLNQMCNKCLRIVFIFLLDRLIGWIISWTDLYEMDVISLSWNMASLTSKMKSYILLITLVVFNLLQASKASKKEIKMDISGVSGHFAEVQSRSLLSWLCLNSVYSIWWLNLLLLLLFLLLPYQIVILLLPHQFRIQLIKSFNLFLT